MFHLKVGFLRQHPIYKQAVRKKWEKIPGQQYQCKIVDVKLNIEDAKSNEEQWRNVRLLFVRGNSEADSNPPANTTGPLLSAPIPALMPHKY
ncbi:hypothetical protein BGP_2900 [Beggiatoa sp. PS]|nr:hypothetical protein BGP_2900 [Beggiatoa sp. PS]